MAPAHGWVLRLGLNKGTSCLSAPLAGESVSVFGLQASVAKGRDIPKLVLVLGVLSWPS